MNVLKLAAFSQNGHGGNPAGVAFYDVMPSDNEMLRIAKEVGYSETAFLVEHPQGRWLARPLFCAGVGSAVLRARDDCAGSNVR